MWVVFAWVCFVLLMASGRLIVMVMPIQAPLATFQMVSALSKVIMPHRISTY